jgi:hypothetical protein
LCKRQRSRQALQNLEGVALRVTGHHAPTISPLGIALRPNPTSPLSHDRGHPVRPVPDAGVLCRPAQVVWAQPDPPRRSRSLARMKPTSTRHRRYVRQRPRLRPQVLEAVIAGTSGDHRSRLPPRKVDRRDQRNRRCPTKYRQDADVLRAQENGGTAQCRRHRQSLVVMPAFDPVADERLVRVTARVGAS